MKVEELPSGNYRVRKTYNGIRYCVTFDHVPSDSEITLEFAERIKQDTTLHGTFEFYAKEYIKDRSNIISPATVRTYNIKLKQLSHSFKSMKITNIRTEDVQREINLFAKDHAPKTTQTLHGFIASVIGAYCPSVKLRTKLPQKIAKEEYEPSSDDIKRILEAVKGTMYSVPFQLGVLGCRRAEICALDMGDLKGNELWIHRSKVYLDGKWIVKETPKTEESNRTIYLPNNLVQEIQEQGYIYNNYPASLYKGLQATQKKLGIPQFKFHTLRSYFASYAHSLGIPDADIMALGGWKTDAVMKKVYRKSIEESKKKSMNRIATGIFN